MDISCRIHKCVCVYECAWPEFSVLVKSDHNTIPTIVHMLYFVVCFKEVGEARDLALAMEAASDAVVIVWLVQVKNKLIFPHGEEVHA